jgi:hypothetical protein
MVSDIERIFAASSVLTGVLADDAEDGASAPTISLVILFMSSDFLLRHRT